VRGRLRHEGAKGTIDHLSHNFKREDILLGGEKGDDSTSVSQRKRGEKDLPRSGHLGSFLRKNGLVW